MNVLKSNRRALAFLGTGAAAGSGALFFFARHLIGYFLVAALLIGLVWIGSHYLVQLLKRRKQRQFDAGVAAREGIDDRKREWASWTAELEQQGIDRYDLPFYLLVGEPQSGKSVLLQNSDLTFPFGQTRLSGIGGTRGCDWWFTEEAVILDLAGRLFTHEGGASDEAEWEAFLGLLASYRPICPANGLMLVIPCDSLLRDSRDEVGRKASKIQNALLTLTNQLQAQLPIYVVLTKADRIFGFAETVHRLDAEQRQQMFGWSRSADDFEAQFDMVEVRRAFDGMVGRARSLRESMMSSVRLPEGINEVDRMYAFPDELEALAPNLEVYLKRIFSESKLVDRLYFRGFYLTSGLQTGTPIANVCAELLGGAGEADKRDLSALFTKQQAYFIKDLVRRRVFSERGLVRPTQTRVAHARRNAWIGYGAAASLAVVSVIWSVVYVLGEYQQSDLAKFRSAIRLSADVANAATPEVDAVLAALDATWEAKQVAPRSLEGAGISRSESFEELFCRLCDQRLVPALRRIAEKRVGELSREEPATHAEFRRRAEQVRLLLAGFDPSDHGILGNLSDLFDAKIFARASTALDHRLAFAQDTAIPPSLRAGGPGSELGPDLAQAARQIDSLWSRTTTGGDALQVGGPAGYVVAWHAVAMGHEYLASLRLGEFDGAAFTRRVEDFHRAAVHLRSPETAAALPPAGKQWRLTRKAVDQGLDALQELRAGLTEARDGTRPEPWRERETLRAFEDQVFGPSPQVPADVSSAVEALDGPKVTVPTEELTATLSEPLVNACAPDVLAFDRQTSPAGLPQRMREALAAAGRDDGSGLAVRVIQARCRLLQDAYLARFPDWSTLAATLGGDGPDRARRALVPGIDHLVGLLEILPQVAPDDAALFDPWSRAATGMLSAALREAGPAVREWSSEGEPRLDPQLLRALVRVRARGESFGITATKLIEAHVEAVDARLAARWAEEDPSAAESTAALLRTLSDHLAQVRGAMPSDQPEKLVEGWLERDVRGELERRLRAHLEKLARACTTVDESASVVAAAGRIDGILSPAALRAWQDSLVADWKVLDAAAVQSSVDGLAAWPQLASVLDSLRRTSTREREFANYFKSGSRADALKRRLEPIRNLPDTGSGPRLARALKDLRADRPDSPPQSVADWYLDRMFESIDKKAVAELRRQYEADLRAKFDFRDNLELALYPKTADIDKLADTRGAIATDFEAFLGPTGELEKLRRDYVLGGGFEFRPDRDEAGSAGVWAFDHFLTDLRTFVQPDPAAKSLDDAKVEIRLVPIDLNKGVWAFSYLFTIFQPGTDHFVDMVNLVSRSQLGPLAWSFGADGSDDLWFRWTRSASGSEQPDDAQLRIGSCLAPLVLVWSFGKPLEEGPASDDWSIDAPTRSTDAVHAHFELKFERPVPLRPPYPWQS